MLYKEKFVDKINKELLEFYKKNFEEEFINPENNIKIIKKEWVIRIIFDYS